MISWFVLISLGAIWGASYLLIKVGGAEIPPFTFVAGRTLIASLALFVALRLRHESLPRSRREWLPLIAMGVLNGVIPYTLITWGETHISSGMAAILTAAMPLFTVILAHYWTHDERLTPSKIVGITLGFLGVVVLFWPELRQGIHLEFWGELAVVIAAASYAAATLVARKHLQGRVLQPVGFDEYLEAALPFAMGVIGARAVEGLPPLPPGHLQDPVLRNEEELRLRVNKLLDEPGARHAT